MTCMYIIVVYVVYKMAGKWKTIFLDDSILNGPTEYYVVLNNFIFCKCIIELIKNW